ncbi:hypothetical protein Droror1_Dr00023644 [Drosera rotundifolia]
MKKSRKETKLSLSRVPQMKKSRKETKLSLSRVNTRSGQNISTINEDMHFDHRIRIPNQGPNRGNPRPCITTPKTRTKRKKNSQRGGFLSGRTKTPYLHLHRTQNHHCTVLSPSRREEALSKINSIALSSHVESLESQASELRAAIR